MDYMALIKGVTGNTDDNVNESKSLEQQLEEIKLKYNKLLARHYKAEIYIDNASIPIEEREKHIGAFKEVINDINRTIKEYETTAGVKMTTFELQSGFIRNIR